MLLHPPEPIPSEVERPTQEAFQIRAAKQAFSPRRPGWAESFGIEFTILGKSKDCQTELRTRNQRDMTKIDDVMGCFPEGCDYSCLARTTGAHPLDLIACM
jgi:hypothetical protein